MRGIKINACAQVKVLIHKVLLCFNTAGSVTAIDAIERG